MASFHGTRLKRFRVRSLAPRLRLRPAPRLRLRLAPRFRLRPALRFRLRLRLGRGGARAHRASELCFPPHRDLAEWSPQLGREATRFEHIVLEGRAPLGELPPTSYVRKHVDETETR